MIRLKDTRHTNTADFLGGAIRIAEYYGFAPVDEMRPIRAPERKRDAKHRPEPEIMFARRDERALRESARKFLACAPHDNSEPLLAWRVTATQLNVPAHALELHVIGASSAIAEALLLTVGNAIIGESGIGNRYLSINNIGSSESSNRYVRDIGSYLRKHIDTISPTLRPRAALDPLGTLVQLIERGHPAAPRAPQAMEYLTEDERRRFWELLEYLEVSGLAYELSPMVLGSRDCWAHALYEISTVDEETGVRLTLASGGRYDPLATRLRGAHTPAATITITCETRGKHVHKRQVRGLPAIYFAHLGPEARRRALVVLENLRRAEIPVYQSLLYERIGEQMVRAKQLATPFILIIGYKEAMENTVLVREVSTNSQEAIPTDELPNYLRRRRMGTWKSLSARL
ncbi:MAG TPA: His/Gly/Thr/Pro-type tRNA ligase C-terminal domain-containing protein [Candidatus Paceibacterota bacterium]